MLQPGALGGWLAEIGILQHAFQQLGIHLAFACPAAIVVIVLLQMASGPGVHQAIARPAIIAGNPAFGRQDGEIGDSADVQNRTIFLLVVKDFLV